MVGGFIGQNGLNAPDAPAIGTPSVVSGTSASITFTAPANVGGSPVTEYIAVATDASGNSFGAVGASSPITITGLTTNVSYTIKVLAVNAYGTSPYSAASNSVTPVTQGQQAFTTAGTYSWTAPAGVTSVSVVAVGGGGSGTYGMNYGGSGGSGGGGLGYKNNITVVPGNSYTVVVGARGQIVSPAFYTAVAGGDSYFINTSTVRGGGGGASSGASGGIGGTYTGDGGGNGGNGGNGRSGVDGGAGGGGGAGGYSGNGGNGGNGAQSAGSNGSNGTSGSGGGGGGGGGGGSEGSSYGGGGAGGGHVGILGEGSSGSGGNGGTSSSPFGSSGGGGSGGVFPNYGGASGGGYNSAVRAAGGGSGGLGAVRIIWPGSTRQFPSTNTADV